ncbi:hypothetical protein ACH5BK_04625 [Arcobacter sp. YIC-80]|uniref:hypothetical protein n=1 Tax=Arcobacter sp. YIC-80 TaxID=3376683 RepID=UPI00384CC843
MPQLIAMVIVVVGAMIYMFQTFGGTGDKIEGIAQKTSIITEINNIRNGVQLAVRAGDITNDGTTTTTLRNLAELGYFADQINNEINDNNVAGNGNTQDNAYSAISFGGEDNPGMIINLVTDNTADTADNISNRPGLRVRLLGELQNNVAFLESQIASDLEAIASIDRTTTDGTPVVLDGNGNVPAANRPADVTVPAGTAAGTAADNLDDGIFTIYFKDMPANVEQN